MAKKKAAASQDQSADSSEESASTTAEAVAASTSRPRKFQAFERIIVKRSTLRFHELNPRSIDPHAFKKLREFIRKQKLLAAVQANRRLAANGFDPEQSGNGQLVLIGGHQRIRAMDDISGFVSLSATPDADYDVPVDVAELSPAKEKECLIALNNPGMQGAFDYDILSELLTSPGVDPLAVGFDKPELASFIDAGILEQIIGAPAAAQAAAEAPVFSDFAAIAESGREADAAARAAEKERTNATVQVIASIPGQAVASVDGQQLTPEQIQQQAIDGMKARRQEYQSSVNADVNAASFMLVLVADTDEERAEFLTQLQFDPTTEFLPLSQFKDALENLYSSGNV